MATIIRIEDIAQYVDQKVTIRGWLYARTGKGRLQFLRVRDGTGIVQAVAFRKEMDPEVFSRVGELTQESSIVITGTVRADERAPGYPGGYEIGLEDVQVVQMAHEYPISPKEHGVEFLMDHRHLWLRSTRQWAILRVRATIIKAIRDWLDDNGFLLVDTPLLTPAAAEGTTTLFELDYFGQPAYLSQSGQLYNEATIGAFGKTYCFGPAFRAEKSKTRRHVMELWMVEPEAAYVELDECMEIEEQLVSYVVQTTLRDRRTELEILERDLSMLENIKPPFPRGAKTLGPRRKHWSPSSLTNRSLSITIQRRSRPFTWPRNQDALRSASRWTCWPLRAMARSLAAASAPVTWLSWSSRSNITSCPRTPMAGTSTCGATGACPTLVLGWASSARCAGSASCRTSVNRSPFRACWERSIRSVSMP
jgi:hypothetical protein